MRGRNWGTWTLGRTAAANGDGRGMERRRLARPRALVALTGGTPAGPAPDAPARSQRRGRESALKNACCPESSPALPPIPSPAPRYRPIGGRATIYETPRGCPRYRAAERGPNAGVGQGFATPSGPPNDRRGVGRDDGQSRAAIGTRDWGGRRGKHCLPGQERTPTSTCPRRLSCRRRQGVAPEAPC